MNGAHAAFAERCFQVVKDTQSRGRLGAPCSVKQVSAPQACRRGRGTLRAGIVLLFDATLVVI
jgi:hypothetical protein